MATKNLPVVRIAVCGLTSSSFSGMSGQGAGKSCLCNRFVRPKKDDLCLNHTSLLNHSDFGSSVVNNDHFLYWGEKKAALEDGTITFQIIEHTEFMEDGNLQLFPFSKPYHKRCIQQKLVSGGKVQYVNQNQLAMPEEFSAGRFPEKFVVDGYIICIDVSADLDNPASQQRVFLNDLLPSILGVKRAHVVVAYTKFDSARESSIAAANELLAKCKRQVTVIEVSALEGVNVDVCFLVLAHLVDSKRPRTRISSYAEAHSHLKERVRKVKESFQTVLCSKVTDFSLSLRSARNLLENEVEFLVLRELCGRDRVDPLIREQLRSLKENRIKTKLMHFLDYLQACLELFLLQLTLSDTVDTCKRTIRTHKKFLNYFMENKDWRDDVTVLKEEKVTHIPFSILDEPEGRDVLQQHMDKVLAPLREDAAIEVITNTLENASNLVPGRSRDDVMRELGLSDQCALVSSEKVAQIYKDRMNIVSQECVNDIIELLLEHPHLFTRSEEDTHGNIQRQLKDDVRYQRLEEHAVSRTSAIIKHIAVMKWPDKSQYAESHILETNSIQDGAPSQEELLRAHTCSEQTDSSNSSNWTLDTESQSFRLAVLGRTNENALTLRSDFMNHMSGSGVCEVNYKRYQMELALYHGNITTLHTHDCLPQGAVAVVNSMECLVWLERVLQLLWIPGGDIAPPYRGLPLVILALDDSIMGNDTAIPNTPFCQKAKQLADSVQCVMIVERPTVQPKRLVVTSVISSLLTTLLDSVASFSEFIASDLVYRPNGLNVAVFTLAGDPYSPQDLLLPWLRHQAICHDKKGKSLFINCALEKQHSTVHLTFHSALNTLDLEKTVHTGYILAYSPHRKASFAILKHLMSQLQKLPVLIIAVVAEGSGDSHVTAEGQQLAEQNGAYFLATSSPEWGIGCTSHFFSKCWYSRFTSWQIQNYNPRGNKDRPLPQPISAAHSSMQNHNEPSSAPTPHGLPPLPPSSRPQSPPRPSSFAGLLSDGSISPPSTRVPLPSPINTRSLPRPSRKEAITVNGKKNSEDVIYSDPVEVAMDAAQKKLSLKRRKERDRTLQRSQGSGSSLSPGQNTLMRHISKSACSEDSTYADPKDIIKYIPEPAEILSPSDSPPSPPPSELNFSPLEDLYASVQPVSSNAPPSTVQSPQSSIGRGYDHLSAMSRQVSGKYDQLQPNMDNEGAMNGTNTRGHEFRECPPSERPPAPLPEYNPVHHPIQLYASVDVTRKTSRNFPPEPPGGFVPEPQAMYASVDVTRKTSRNFPPEPPGGFVPEPQAMYASVDVTRKTSRNFPPEPPGDFVPNNMYATITEATKTQKKKVPTPSESPKPPPPAPTEAMYATVDSSRKSKKSLTTVPVTSGNGHIGVDMGRKPPVPSPPSLARNSGHETADSAQMPVYATVDTSRRKRTPPPVRPRSPRSPMSPSPSGGSPEFLRGSLERQRKPTAPLVKNGGHSRRKSNEALLVPVVAKVPVNINKKPPPPTAPKPRRSPSPAMGSADSVSRPFPRGRSFDLDEQTVQTNPAHSPRRVGSPQLPRKTPSPSAVQRLHTENPRTRTESDPHFEKNRVQRRPPKNTRVRSSEDLLMVTRGGVVMGDDGGDSGQVRGDDWGEDTDQHPVIPARNYSASEMDLDDEPPPLPPRNYNWSDVEDDDDDLFQSEDELEEPSVRISLADQQAMYSSLRLYQKRTNSSSSINELYAIVNQVAKEQETTQQSSSLPESLANEAANVYDTLESALKQKDHLEMKRGVTAAMKQSVAGAAEKSPHTSPALTTSAVGALGGAGHTVFTPRQLKLIKQQQKLLNKLQKKTEREAERRRKSEQRQKKREEEEQRKRDGRKRGKKIKYVKEPERQRYFGSPLEKIVESDGVPRFIKQCTKIIETKGLKIEGMYRVSGKKDACLFLQDQYDQDFQLDVASLELCETTISSTLKAFFKLLPEPLISNYIAAKVLDINADELSDQKKRLQSILQQMPVPNLNTLRYLMLHLHKVQELQEINKMTSSNLAIVFWPTLMRPPLTDLADPGKQMCWQLMMAQLIEHPGIIPEAC